MSEEKKNQAGNLKTAGKEKRLWYNEKGNDKTCLSNVHIQRNPTQRTGFISCQPTCKTHFMKRMLTEVKHALSPSLTAKDRCYTCLTLTPSKESLIFHLSFFVDILTSICPMREILALACREVASGGAWVGLVGSINSDTRSSVIETRRPPWMTRTYFIVRTIVLAVGC